jgi:hypothetical protein
MLREKPKVAGIKKFEESIRRNDQGYSCSFQIVSIKY